MSAKFFNAAPLRRLIGALVGAYMAFVDRSTRWTEIDRAGMKAFAAGAPMIGAFWHGRIFMAPHAWSRRRAGGRRAYMLVSQSKDGDAIAAAAEMCGVRTIRGSTAKRGKDKGGAGALRALIGVLKQHGAVAITPDGPKGPRMRASLGVIQLAKLSGAPIVPFAWSTRGRRALKSWDRFALPAPFSSGVFIWDTPIWVDRNADDCATEAARLALEEALNRITLEADMLCQAAPVAPQPSAELA